MLKICSQSLLNHFYSVCTVNLIIMQTVIQVVKNLFCFISISTLVFFSIYSNFFDFLVLKFSKKLCGHKALK